MENNDLGMILDGIYGFLKNIDDSIKNTDQTVDNKDYQELTSKLTSIEDKLGLIDGKFTDSDSDDEDDDIINELQQISNKLDEYRELQAKSKIDIFWLRLGTVRKVLLMLGLTLLFAGMFVSLIYLTGKTIVCKNNDLKYRYLKILDSNETVIKVEKEFENKRNRKQIKKFVEYQESYAKHQK